MTGSGIQKPKTPQETTQLMKVALGEEKADLTIVNANVVNVYTGEILPDQGIGIKGKWIAYVGENAKLSGFHYRGNSASRRRPAAESVGGPGVQSVSSSVDSSVSPNPSTPT